MRTIGRAFWRLFWAASFFVAGYVAAGWGPGNWAGGEGGGGLRPFVWIGLPDAVQAELDRTVERAIATRLEAWFELFRYAGETRAAIDGVERRPSGAKNAGAATGGGKPQGGSDAVEVSAPAVPSDELVRAIDVLEATMTPKEKAEFLRWAQARLTPADVRRLAEVFGRGLTLETLGEAYTAVREKLSPEDLAYLFSLLERYAQASRLEWPAFGPDGDGPVGEGPPRSAPTGIGQKAAEPGSEAPAGPGDGGGPANGSREAAPPGR
ncbi:hypothetical protein [Hydrogenibacillus sp. N12]|uniref:hypothetical protein n=1 Tax=Hydrogenibacillus sp. N12 TaxID=2866627 RepID=UPI001C7D1D23|nr:hypothetical protein [Hydrogenibacillus sp. N12]QZA32684.1 hypothetical protein K2M58_10465 [Hydrogenibacillus sp. N12]